jgi:BirA family biotin operon repressor/biotin-[acetyl-CoA-carboxylase] ligase
VNECRKTIAGLSVFNQLLTLIIGSNIIFHKNIASTNTCAALLLKKEKPPEGTIIYTNFQSAGKGQKGNKWVSEDGKNLLLSIILFPDMIRPEKQFCISMAISLGICDFLKGLIPVCKIKWPNDIYAGDDKIAGILIENSIIGSYIESTVAGIGLNINQVNFPAFLPNPVSLKLITGKDHDPYKCLKELAAFLDRRYKQLVSGETAEIKEDSHLKHVEECITIR